MMSLKKLRTNKAHKEINNSVFRAGFGLCTMTNAKGHTLNDKDKKKSLMIIYLVNALRPVHRKKLESCVGKCMLSSN